MVIDPTQEFVMLELQRIKWFLSHIDLTRNPKAGEDIEDAYANISNAIKKLER